MVVHLLPLFAGSVLVQVAIGTCKQAKLGKCNRKASSTTAQFIKPISVPGAHFSISYINNCLVTLYVVGAMKREKKNLSVIKVNQILIDKLGPSTRSCMLRGVSFSSDERVVS